MNYSIMMTGKYIYFLKVITDNKNCHEYISKQPIKFIIYFKMRKRDTTDKNYNNCNFK